MKKINIMGSDWTIEEKTIDDDLKLKDSDGYCDWTVKKIIIDKITITGDTVEDLKKYKNNVLRHEIIHAFMQECGNMEMSRNELIVEWLAVNWNKISKVFKNLEL